MSSALRGRLVWGFALVLVISACAGEPAASPAAPEIVDGAVPTGQTGNGGDGDAPGGTRLATV